MRVNAAAPLWASVSMPMVPRPPGTSMAKEPTVTVPLMVPLPPRIVLFAAVTVLEANEPGLLT